MKLGVCLVMTEKDGREIGFKVVQILNSEFDLV